MLNKEIVILLVALIGTSCAQGEMARKDGNRKYNRKPSADQVEETSSYYPNVKPTGDQVSNNGRNVKQNFNSGFQPNQQQVYPNKPGNYIGSFKHQTDNIFVTKPGSTNTYGSVTQGMDQAYHTTSGQGSSRVDYASSHSGGSIPKLTELGNGTTTYVYGDITVKIDPANDKQSSNTFPQLTASHGSYESQTHRPQANLSYDGGYRSHAPSSSYPYAFDRKPEQNSNSLRINDLLPEIMNLRRVVGDMMGSIDSIRNTQNATNKYLTTLISECSVQYSSIHNH